MDVSRTDADHWHMVNDWTRVPVYIKYIWLKVIN